MKRTLDNYKEIIDHPRHVSKNRPQMARADRAAQFMPFSAVVGYDAAVKEAGRYTDCRKELDELEKSLINESLREIESRLPQKPSVEVLYFEPDPYKAGGTYRKLVGTVTKIDVYTRHMIFEDGSKIPIEEIYSIDQ